MSVEKLNIYKIKSTVTDFSDFVKTTDSKKNALPELRELTVPTIDGFNGAVAVKAAFKKSGGTKTTADIPWLSFINQANPAGGPFDFSWTNQFPSALVAIRITIDGVSTFFALTFGMAGDSFLNNDMIVHDFGIKVAMNICDADKLKRIQASIHEAVSTQTERQISSNSNLSVFNINGEKEFLRMLVGATRTEYDYISSFKGKEAISLKLDAEEPLTWETLIPRVHKLGQESLGTRYREIFKDYDKFPFETDPAVISELDAILFAKIKAEDYSGIHLAPPEFFDYDAYLFLYGADAGGKTYEELEIKDLVGQRRRKFRDDADIESIKNIKISLYDANTGTVVKNKWSAYKCVVAEVSRGNDTYILSIGQWRKVSADLQHEVTSFVGSIVFSDPAYLPQGVRIWNPQAKGGNGKPYKGENQEAVFNQTAESESADLFLFDKGRVEIAGEKKYEVCDLLHKDKILIQVKKYSSGSASISHLFVQARFYAEAFLFDEKCRTSMAAHITEKARGRNIVSFLACVPKERKALDAKDYRVCLCLLTEQSGFSIVGLPFMAKYELMHTLRHIENLGLGYEVVVRAVKYGPEQQDENTAREEEAI